MSVSSSRTTYVFIEELAPHRVVEIVRGRGVHVKAVAVAVAVSPDGEHLQAASLIDDAVAGSGIKGGAQPVARGSDQSAEMECRAPCLPIFPARRATLADGTIGDSAGVPVLS